jgi:hypothetical protein
VEAGLVLESSDLMLEFSYILAMLSWWFLGHARKVFDEMLVMGKVLSWEIAL